MRRLLVIAVTFTFCACLQAQRPVVLSVSGSGDAIGSVARALAAEGLTPESSDPSTGIVVTRWHQHGYCAHPKSAKDPGLLSTRHVALVGPQSITLRLEAQCCLGGSVDIGNVLVRGNCVERDGVTETEQTELNVLGGRLEAALQPPRG